MTLWNRIRNRFRRDRLEQELDAEIRAHREMLADEYEREGLPSEEARLAASRRFGSVASFAEQSRDEWSFAWIDACLRDVRFALRLMLRQPLLTATAVLAVAFGVGANTAIVSVLQTALLNPLGIHDTGAVMVARVHLEKLQMMHSTTSAVEFNEIQAMGDVFSVAAATQGRVWTSPVNGDATRVIGTAVTADFFRVFGENPALGRFFAPEDRTSVVLSHALWQSRFGGDQNVVGRGLVLDGRSYTVIGVASENFRFPASGQVWIPLQFDPATVRRGYNMVYTVLARRKPGITEGQARDRVMRYSQSLLSPESDSGRQLRQLRYGFELDPFAEFVGGDLRRPLWLLWAAALAVLLTACANVAGLLLTRSSARRREMAIRLSVGGTRLQIVRQLLIESLLLGLTGGAAGLLMARFTIPLLGSIALPARAVIATAVLDRRMLLYGFALAAISGLLFGLAPALQLLRSSQTSELARSRRKWFQDAFVVAEVASAFALIVLTLLLVRSLAGLQRVDIGFDSHRVTIAQLIQPRNDPGFADRLESTLRSSPGVQGAAVASSVPFGSGGSTSGFNIKDRTPLPDEPEWHGAAYMVTPGYFETLRIPLLQGRLLSPADRNGAALVCVVDAQLASRFFPQQDPIGHEISMFQGWARIVGVVGTIHEELEHMARPTVYYSLDQVPYGRTASLLVRSTVPAAGVIREAIRRTGASAPVYDAKLMDDLIDDSQGVRRVMAVLLSAFGAVSLLLAALGLYGVVAQVVAERVQEIGIRMALGARPQQILTHFLKHGLRAGLAGLAVGLLAAAWSQRLLTSYLYEVRPFDPLTFLSASMGILLMLAIAVWWPARRAARVDAQVALRHE